MNFYHNALSNGYSYSSDFTQPPFLSFPPFIQYRLSTLEEMHCSSQRASTYLTSIMGLLCFNAQLSYTVNVSEGRKVCFFHRCSGFRHSPQHGTGHKARQDTIIQMSLTDRVQYTLTLSESNSGQYLTPRSCPLNRGRSKSGSEEYV